MKTLYIEDIFRKNKLGEEVEILGWLKSKRNHGSIIFLEIVDSTGSITATVRKDIVASNTFRIVREISTESSVKLKGRVVKTPESKRKEIMVRGIKVIGMATLNINPSPRKDFNIFHSKYVDFTLRKRHLFLRNPKIMAVMKIKFSLIEGIREWFRKQRFIEIDTPILTQSTLYEDSATFNVNYFGTQVYLSQCAGLYLEAAIPAFEKVYTFAPAFRKQPSRSPRHNPEFWHVKAQVAFYDLNEIMNFVENLIHYITNYINKKNKQELKILGVTIDTVKPPFPRINYTEALKIFRAKGLRLEWGKNLNEKAEKILSEKFKKPLYVIEMPRNVEPFPYSIDSVNPEVTKTADLLAPNGYGEILGVAEFIDDPNELIKRIKESGKHQQIKRFKWYLELKQYGSVPHSGFGMGVERVLRWLLKLPHVRNTFPFPRLYHRVPYP